MWRQSLILPACSCPPEPKLKFSHVGKGDQRSHSSFVRMLGSDAMLQLDAVARGDRQQIGGSPDPIVLELADLSVGEHELPHHLDDPKPAGLIDLAHDDAGEV